MKNNASGAIYLTKLCGLEFKRRFYKYLKNSNTESDLIYILQKYIPVLKIHV